MTKPRTSYLLEQVQALDALLTKIVTRPALRLVVTDTEGSGSHTEEGYRRAVTDVGARLFAAGGVDLMVNVHELVMDLDLDDWQRREPILDDCWRGIGDADERFEPGPPFRF